MSFDDEESRTGHDEHGECRHEIHELEAENARLRERLEDAAIKDWTTEKLDQMEKDLEKLRDLEEENARLRKLADERELERVIAIRESHDLHADNTRLRAELAEARTALQGYVRAQRRILERWAESDDAVKARLWSSLHMCENEYETAIDAAMTEGEE